MLFAYIDPATGAMVLQVIVAAVLATVFSFASSFSCPLPSSSGKVGLKRLVR